MSTKRKTDPELVRARGRVAGLSRDRAEDDPEYMAAKLNLAELKLVVYVRKEAVSAMGKGLSPEEVAGRLDRVASELRLGKLTLNEPGLS